MPYISNSNKRTILDTKAWSAANSIDEGGDLNYFICRLLVNLGPESYHEHRANMADVTEAVKEYRRKVLAPYEDKKEQENGTVFEETV